MPECHITTVSDEGVEWRLPDLQRRLDGVRLWSDYDLGDTSFRRDGDGWVLRRSYRALPEVNRLEYSFEVTENGVTGSVLDAGNPLRVAGVFGDHSWLSLGYRPPAWLEVEPVVGDRRPLVVSTAAGDVHVQIWSPVGVPASEKLPLLLSHDGPEMDTLGELTRFIGAMTASGRLPPIRVGLLAPGARDERYAANPVYAEALCMQALPAVLEVAPTEQPPVLMGQSLGALAALHAEWTHPGTFAGLLLQSGSFFTPELDAQESRYSQWKPVTGFVADVLTATTALSTPPVTVCFGSAEENARNNRLMAAKLAELGYDVSTGSVPDGHNFTCWRDLLDPHLTDLLRKVF